jgi:NADPH-dependent 2,4-dienoyl-CoA reductase/sulfur reductase-like enzyme
VAYTEREEQSKMATEAESASDLVVIGGGAGGMTAASRARRRQADWRITVFERGDYVSFILCGLPYYVDDVIASHESLIVYTPEFFEKERRIKVHTGHEVRRIDHEQRLLEVTDLRTDRAFTWGYGKLIVATGAEAVRPRLEGIDLGNVFVLRTIADGRRIKAALQEGGLGHAVVIGAGYVGVEMAEALTEVGLETVLIEATANVLPGIGPEIGEVVERELADHGVSVHKEEMAQRLEGGQRVEGVVASRGRYPAEIVIVSVGARPAVGVLQEAGVALGPTGAVATNERMETNLSGVYAVGDVAEAHHLVSGEAAWVPLGTTANKQGRVAGENAAGGSAVFQGIVGTAAVKVFGLEVARTGLTEVQAREAGFDPVGVTIEHSSHASYYPGVTKLRVKLVADRQNGRLLGGQIVGREAAAKRVDVLAAALHARMDVEAITALDLSYAPPFAPAWEAIQIAAQQVMGEVQRLKRS